MNNQQYTLEITDALPRNSQYTRQTMRDQHMEPALQSYFGIASDESADTYRYQLPTLREIEEYRRTQPAAFYFAEHSVPLGGIPEPEQQQLRQNMHYGAAFALKFYDDRLHEQKSALEELPAIELQTIFGAEYDGSVPRVGSAHTDGSEISKPVEGHHQHIYFSYQLACLGALATIPRNGRARNETGMFARTAYMTSAYIGEQAAVEHWKRRPIARGTPWK